MTTDGKVILDKPQFRETSFHTSVFDNYSRVEKSHNTYKDVLEDLYNRGLKEPLLIVVCSLKYDSSIIDSTALSTLE